jgi:SAM-dependent methyltransferase
MPVFYRDRIYPYLVSRLGDPKPIREVRRQIIPLARGTVLEIGAGAGANFPYYQAEKVRKLYALEPNPGMVRLAERQRRESAIDIEFLDLPGEHVPLTATSVDTVVSAFTLCTISDVMAAVREITRVLKPDGQLIFFELGLAPDLRVRRWQTRLEPIHKGLFRGLHLTRDIPSLLREAGFVIDHMQARYVAAFPKALSYCWWGTAMLRVEQQQ